MRRTLIVLLPNCNTFSSFSPSHFSVPGRQKGVPCTSECCSPLTVISHLCAAFVWGVCDLWAGLALSQADEHRRAALLKPDLSMEPCELLELHCKDCRSLVLEAVM